MISLFTNLWNKNYRQVICQIKLEENDQWIRGMIFNINAKQGLLRVFIQKEYFDAWYKENSTVKIKYQKDNCEFVLDGMLIDKKVSSWEQSWTVKFQEIQEYPNKRKHERFNFQCSATIEIIEVDQDGKMDKEITRDKDYKEKAKPMLLNNISEKGVLLSCNTPIELEDSAGDILETYVEVKMVALPNKVISFIGKILRSSQDKERYYYAVKVHKINEENSKRINELLVFLAMQKNMITQAWEDFGKIK